MDSVKVVPTVVDVDFASIHISVPTEYGDINVICNEEVCNSTSWTSGRVMITCPDLGLSPNVAFGTLFNFDHLKPLINSFNLIHIDLFSSQLTEWLSMETIAEVVLDAVVQHFGIVTFVGLGIGFGADLLAKYSSDHPYNVTGLILCKPTMYQLSWIDWMAYKKHLWWLWWGWGVTENTVSVLNARFFEQPAEELRDLAANSKHCFSQCDANILHRFLWAYCTKSDQSEAIGKSRTRTLLIYREDSGFAENYIDPWLGEFRRPRTVTQLGIREAAGTLATEQHVALCAETVYLWLQGLGFRVDYAPLQSFDEYLKK